MNLSTDISADKATEMYDAWEARRESTSEELPIKRAFRLLILRIGTDAARQVLAKLRSRVETMELD